MTENKIKIIKNFNNHRSKGCNFNNDNYKWLVSVVIEILKGIIKKNNRIKETHKMRSKTKRTAVKNIIIIAAEKNAVSKRK